MTADHSLLDAVTPTSTVVEPALVIEDADDIAWDERCDVLVVGAGLAGTAASLRAAEDAGMSVITIDRGMGGGASQISGGIVYMGGGTRTQREAGVQDSAEEMSRYLAMETGDVVRPDTLSRFAHASTQFEAWLERHGARFGGPATDAKTSYPYDASLYYSGNEKSVEGRERAEPAPRGHRAKPPKGGEPKKLSGAYLLPPLLKSMERQPNIRLWRQTRATRMIVDRSGAVVGIEVARIRSGLAGWRHGFLYGLGNNMAMAMLKLVGRIHGTITAIEGKAARPLRVRVSRGVVLAAGGFTYNREMMARTAPRYLKSAPLGTLADDGSGIRLGMTVGAKTDRLDRISAWRFLYPPASWTRSCSVGPDGQRLVNEELYGARTGEAVFKNEGKGWLILDQPLQDEVRREIAAMKKMFFQKVQFRAVEKEYTVSADTLAELADRIGVPPQRMAATIADYNRAIGAGEPDPAGKSEKVRSAISEGPFYATDIGASLKLSPIPALTMGGLVVDEDTGAVVDKDGRSIAGLFAAGRTAVGICSHYYVSGLSLADCIWSGWRAAETLKGNGGAAALAPEADTPALAMAGKE